MQSVLNLSRQSTGRPGVENREPKVVRLNPEARSENRSNMFPIVTLFVLAAWITASILSDFLFLKEALVSSFIITCLLFQKKSATGKGEDCGRELEGRPDKNSTRSSI